MNFENDEIKVPREIYEEIKRNYLCMKESNSFLYRRYHQKYGIDKRMFLEIVSSIREEEGLPITPFNKKTKRIHNPYAFYDKHPNSYKIEGNYINGYKTSGFKGNGKKSANKLNKKSKMQLINIVS